MREFPDGTCFTRPPPHATKSRTTMDQATSHGVFSDTTQPMRYAITFSDGNRYALTAPTLVGRNPQPAAHEHDTNLIVLNDPLRTVSKTHMLVGVDAAGPYVVDRRSTNGTVVTLPDGQQIICGPEQKVRFTVGSTIMCGAITAKVDLQY
ncbi:FHA domain-containing protein [Timonella senegalensis]|uniref:FHA domain-containing protein n=2 Tax=Timonella senegalensis TaxID=1465825 RepID=UPI002FDEB098